MEMELDPADAPAMLDGPRLDTPDIEMVIAAVTAHPDGEAMLSQIVRQQRTDPDFTRAHRLGVLRELLVADPAGFLRRCGPLLPLPMLASEFSERSIIVSPRVTLHCARSPFCHVYTTLTASGAHTHAHTHTHPPSSDDPWVCSQADRPRSPTAPPASAAASAQCFPGSTTTP